MRLTITLFIIFIIGGTILFLTKNHEIEKEQLKIEQQDISFKNRNAEFNKRLAEMSDGILDLSYLDLHTLPYYLADYPNIRVIDLSHNNLETIPEVLHLLPNLEGLILANNLFSNIKISNSNMISIQNLDLSHNRIENISDIFNCFTEIETLSVASNHLTSFSFEINETLKKLDVSNNKIFSIRKMDNLRILEDINLSNNEIYNLSYMPKGLKKLNCSHNRLIDWRGISEMLVLQEIDFSYNEIPEFDYYDLLPNLETLRLSHNEFLFDEQGLKTFSKYQKLKKLDLSSCDIKHSTEINNNFRTLEYLDLSDNPIKDFMLDNDNLKYLNISETDIVLRYQTIKAPNLETFDITKVFIEGVIVVKLLSLPKLEKLIANETLLCDYELKEEYSNLPELSAIVCD